MPNHLPAVMTRSAVLKPVESRELPPLAIRAHVDAKRIDSDKRTAAVVWSVGARVQRWGYYEELSMDPGHVRLGRLNNGAPLLDSHQSWELRKILGVVEKGTAVIERGEGVAVVRFSKRAEVDPIFRDIEDGIIQNISVGYRVYRYELVERIQEGDDLVPVYRAVDWEPFEVSVVPVGADDAAGFRDNNAPKQPCNFINGPQGTRTEIQNMNAEQIALLRALALARGIPASKVDALIAAGDFAAAKADIERTQPTAASPSPAADAERNAQTVNAERERVADIGRMGRRAGMDQAAVDHAIATGVSADAFSRTAVDFMADRAAAQPGTSQHTRLEVGEDLARVGLRIGVAEALQARHNPMLADKAQAVQDAARPYRGLSLMEIARRALAIAGVNTDGMDKMRLTALALGLEPLPGARGMHSTSDFPLILADVANKSLRRGYQIAPRTYLAISRPTTLPDFRDVNRLQFGDAPQLLKVVEGGVIKRGTIGEGRERYRLATFARAVGITRQAIINDDLQAFTRIPELFGVAAADLESDTVWGIIIDNDAMGDTYNLFSTEHANLAGSGAAIDITSLGAGRTRMRKHKGIGGKIQLNLAPRSLIVAPEKETIADQYVSTITPAEGGKVNPFANRLQVVSEARLSVLNSGATWFLAADPATVDMIEHAHLEGQEGVYMESRIGFDVDGIEIKARLDFAAKAIEYRGLDKNPGA